MLCGFGWVAALVALGFAAAVRVRLRSREELVARACHELRSPLTAARLAVHALGAPDPATARALAVLDLELRRAGLALDDLLAARDGGRRPPASGSRPARPRSCDRERRRRAPRWPPRGSALATRRAPRARAAAARRRGRRRRPPRSRARAGRQPRAVVAEGDLVSRCR